MELILYFPQITQISADPFICENQRDQREN